MVVEQRLSRLERIRRQRSAGFVGRQNEATVFRANLALGTQDEAFKFVFHVHGNGGVGKTSLVRRWEEEARRHGAVTAYVGDEVHSAVEAMERISMQLGRQNGELKHFEKQMSTYRQRRHEAASALAAQSAGSSGGGGQTANPSPVTTTVARAGLVGLGMAPVVGPFASALDAQQVARWAEDGWSALSARLRSPEDVQLVLSPEQVLTPVFVKDVAAVAESRPWVVLFFDTYEQSERVLDVWLRELVLGGDHGELPLNVVVVLSGRGRLNPGWSDVVAEMPLEVFTEDEARQLLAHKGIAEERLVQRILHVSGRLPVLVDMLAQARPPSPEAVEDPASTAVELFLKWETEPGRRAAALACALPLQLNEDVYHVAVTEPVPDGYRWLRGLAFVTNQAGRCRYHEVVRGAMLRLQRIQSPVRWSMDHIRLASAFREWRQAQESALPSNERWDDADWQEALLNETYHLLCAQPREALPEAVLQLVNACKHAVATVHRWAQMVTEAGHDTQNDNLTRLGQQLQGALVDDDAGVIPILTLLLSVPGINTTARALALAVRGRENRIRNNFDTSISDYTAALAVDPHFRNAFAGRGQTRRLMGQYENALLDFNRAIEIDPNHARTVANRGHTHRLMGHYEKALSDYNRAIEMDPNDAWIISGRGYNYHLMGRHEEALTDFDRAIEIDPKYTWAITGRAQSYRIMGRHEEALTDFNRAIEIDPNDAWVISDRAYTYRLMGRHEEALTDFDRAIEIDPKYTWAINSRAYNYHLMGRYEEALADYNRAIEIDPKYTWAITGRGYNYHLMGRYEEALTDFNRAIEIDPNDASTITSRGYTYRLMGRYEEALTDFNRAIEIDPNDASTITSRGTIYRLIGQYDEALGDFNHTLDLRPDNSLAMASRGLVCRLTGQYEAALADLECAAKLDPRSNWIQYELGVALLASQNPRHEYHLLRALELAATSHSTNSTAKVIADKGNVFLARCAMSHWLEADRALTDFLESDPSHGQAYELLIVAKTLLRIDPSIEKCVLRILSRLEDRLAGST